MTEHQQGTSVPSESTVAEEPVVERPTDWERIVERFGPARAFINRWWVRSGSWGMTLLIAAFAALLRFTHLDRPHAFVFDETYYAKDAYSLLRFGVEHDYIDGADATLLKGGTDVLTDTGAYVVHPPVGKWAIALGELLFGMNPFGWRFMMAILGVAAVVLVHRTVLSLGGPVLTAHLTAGAMAIDGMAIVMSRTALLDQTLMFLIVVATWALVKLFRAPHLHRYRWVMLVALGLACATKWSGVWFTVVYTSMATAAIVWRSPGRRRRVMVREALLLPVQAVTVISVYVASWVGWLLTESGWGRDRTDGVSWLPQPLRALLAYHRDALTFHTGLDEAHDYASDPLSWLVMHRPTSFWYSSDAAGDAACGASNCAAEVLALGNVAIWWIAVFAVISFIGMGCAGRLGKSERLSVVLATAGLAAAWLPWVAFRERTTFSFYMVVAVPFICWLYALFVTMVAGPHTGGVVTAALRGRPRAIAACLIVLVTILVSWFFMPLWTGAPLPFDAWDARMWFRTWV